MAATPAQAAFASHTAVSTIISLPGNCVAAATSAASATGTRTILKYGIAMRFASGDISETSPKYSAVIGTSPKLIVNCSAPSVSAPLANRSTRRALRAPISRLDAITSSSATAPYDSQNDTESTANGSANSTTNN